MEIVAENGEVDYNEIKRWCLLQNTTFTFVEK